MRAPGLLQLKPPAHCVVWVKPFSLPVPLFTHPSSDEEGRLGCAGTSWSLLFTTSCPGRCLRMHLALLFGGCQETRFSSLSWVWRGNTTEDSAPTALHQSVLSSVTTSLQLQWGRNAEAGEAAPGAGTVPARALTTPSLQRKSPVIEVFRPGPHTGREQPGV